MKKYYLFLMFLILLGFISAWPMELLQNGTIIESNITNGISVDFIFVNGSLYLIPKVNVTNVTNYNVSNYEITNVTNLTCHNCSYTYFYNATGNYTYNRTELDSRFGNYILTSTANSLFAQKDLSSYALKTDLVNITGNPVGVKESTFWIIVGILFFCIIVIAILLFIQNS